MANKNHVNETYNNERDSFPRSSALTGTHTSQNTLIAGTGSSYLSEVDPGDWLYDQTNSQFAKVESVSEDDRIYLREAFDTPISGATLRLVKEPRFWEVSYEVTGLNDAIIDTQTYEQGEGDVIRRKDKPDHATGDYVDPIDIDTSTNNTTVKLKASR